MKLTKKDWTVIGISAVIAAVIVYASNNVDAVEDVIG